MVNSGAAGSSATITLGAGSSLSVAGPTNGARMKITNAGTISTSGGALVNEADAVLTNGYRDDQNGVQSAGTFSNVGQVNARSR